jgi:hypothetical protein
MWTESRKTPPEEDRHPQLLTIPPLPTTPPVAEAMMAAGPGELLNAHQKALIAFSAHLEREIEEPAGKPARAAAMTAGPLSHVETAKSRVEMFLGQQKAKAGHA